MKNLIKGLEIIEKNCPEATIESEENLIIIDLMSEGIDNKLHDKMVEYGWIPYSDGFKYYL